MDFGCGQTGFSFSFDHYKSALKNKKPNFALCALSRSQQSWLKTRNQNGLWA